MSAMPGSLDLAAPMRSAASTLDRMAAALVGVVARAAAAHHAIAAHDVYDFAARWPSPAARARASTLYLLRIELSISAGDLERLFVVDRRSIRREVERIELRRETDQALDHWLSEMEAALKGEPA